MKVASSWSGGKDSCLAAYKAMEQGHDLAHLLNFVSRKHKRCCFHGIEARLMNLQSESLGIPLFQKEVSPDMKEYEREFKEAVAMLKSFGVEGMVFGDVYLEEHKSWIERVCEDLAIRAIEPLWKMPPEQVIEEFIRLGFRAVVVSAKADLFEKEFVGRHLDLDFLEGLESKGICPCGENGEYHTFVVDGPLFKKRIEIKKSRAVLKQGFWEHWFLDIQEWCVKENAPGRGAAP